MALYTDNLSSENGLNITGSSTFNGSISATSITGITFYGNGSNLTNIPDAYVTAVTLNNVSRTYTLISNTGGTVSFNSLNDIFVTGGTYNNPTGTATFTNNSGGTFNINGFLTGSTGSDTYVTGLTFSNNILTVKQNLGVADISTLINLLTGLTVNGTLTSNTISATTYQNLPAATTGPTISATSITGLTITGINISGSSITGATLFGNGSNLTNIVDTYLTGVTVNNVSRNYTLISNTGGTVTFNGLNDVFVTGGTYSDVTKTLSLTNSTGSTFTVTGFVDKATTGTTLINSTIFFNRSDTLSAYTVNLPQDVYLTAGTYNSSTKIITFVNNSGGTFNVTGLLDVFTTAATFTNNTFTFNNNTGGTYNVLFNTLTGLTVNGTLTSNTISATSVTELTSTINNLSANTVTASTLQSNILSATTISGKTLLIKSQAATSATTAVTITNSSGIIGLTVLNDGSVFNNGVSNILTNTGFGSGVMVNMTQTITASGNTGFGTNANNSLISGFSNTAIGYSVLNNNQYSNNNTGIGSFAINIITGNSNTAVGSKAGVLLSSGNSNTIIGQGTMSAATGTSNNIVIGSDSAQGLLNGSNNTIIGTNISGLPVGLTGNVIISDGLGNTRIQVDSGGNVISTAFSAKTVTGFTIFVNALSATSVTALTDTVNVFSATSVTANTSQANLFSGTSITAGTLTGIGSITSKSPSAGIGYATGAGGNITQLTSKSTGVTGNTTCGVITMNGAALASGTTVAFTITNSSVAATDVIIVMHTSGGTIGNYCVQANTPAAGSFKINTTLLFGPALSEALVIRYAVIKAVIA